MTTLPHLALRPLLAVAIAVLPSCGGAAGTRSPVPTPAPASVSSPAPDTVAPLGTEARDLLQRVKALNLPSSRNQITIYHAEGHAPKALRLRALIEEGMRFYADSLGVREELHLAVLNPEQWALVIT